MSDLKDYNPYVPMHRNKEANNSEIENTNAIETTVKHCPKCGTEITGKFCVECGFNMQLKTNETTEIQEQYKVIKKVRPRKKNNVLSYAVGIFIGLGIVGAVITLMLILNNNVLGEKYTRQIDKNGIESIVTTSGIKIDDAVYVIDTVYKGFKTGVYIENNTGKEIKYISTVSNCYNRVGDPAVLEYSFSNEIGTRFTGPFKDGYNQYFYSNTANGDTVEYMKLDTVIIEYMDGSTETISNIDIAHRYVFQYGNENQQRKY